MKKGLMMAALVLAALLLEFFPMQAGDVQTLSPVTLLTVEKKGALLRVCTDTGDEGYGTTLKAALENMQDTSEKTLYFETAKSIVFEKQALSCAGEAALSQLRPATKVYLAADELPPAKLAADYLKTHSADVTLGWLRAAMHGEKMPELPAVLYREGRLLLAK